MTKNPQHILLGFGSFFAINVLWMIVMTGVLGILPANIRIMNAVLFSAEVVVLTALLLRNRQLFAIGGFVAALQYFVTPYLLFALKVNQ